MSLSRRTDTRHRFPNRREVRFDPDGLAEMLNEQLPEVLFAYILGSAVDGVIQPYSDLDLAVYLENWDRPTFDVISNIMATVEHALEGPVDVDVSVLNTAGPCSRFQALRGRRLFVRPRAMEQYIDLYCITCREYEDYMFRLRRYRRYRREIRNSAA